jgi:hypothetical protein
VDKGNGYGNGAWQVVACRKDLDRSWEGSTGNHTSLSVSCSGVVGAGSHQLECNWGATTHVMSPAIVIAPGSLCLSFDVITATTWPQFRYTQPLLTAHCSLLTAHCSLLTAHCSLATSILG